MSVMTKLVSLQDAVSKMSCSNVWIVPDYETLYYHFRCHFCHTQMAISPSGMELAIESETITKFCHAHRHEIHPEPVITAKATPRAPLPPPAKVATPIPAPIGRKFREEEWA